MDFYALWLDERLVYSCAYFETPEDSLDQAQRQKLDHLCRKLRLEPASRLLDVGCGWGGLVIHAAAEYGVSCTGVTLSEEQARVANDRIARAGLADRCEVRVCDYRSLVAEPFDAAVSVGMFEHVGRRELGRYFARMRELVKPGGVFLNHGIATRYGRPGRAGPFMDRYVFPDGELAPISATLEAAEAAGFEVLDVESLRPHYALTLRHWVHRLESRAEAARALVGPVVYRIWRLYMAGSARAFATGALDVYQTLLFSPGGPRTLPLTRRDWYR